MGIHNYLKKWEYGTQEELIFEIAEKLFDLKIDFDDLDGNQISKLEERIKRLEELLKKGKEC